MSTLNNLKKKIIRWKEKQNKLKNKNNMPENPKITPENALNVIVSAVRQLKLSFDEHNYLNQCVEVLAQLVQNATPKVEKLEKVHKKLPTIVDKEE